MKKIGLVAECNPFITKKEWSGTISKVAEVLVSCGYDVKIILAKRPFWLKVFSRLRAEIFYFLFQKNTHIHYTTIEAKNYAKFLKHRIPNDIDYLFVPAWTAFIAYLDYNKPIILMTDSTFKLNSSNYYPLASNLSSYNYKEGNEIEQEGFDKSSIIICCSDWAKKSIINDYCQNCDKVHVLELGANFDNKEICYYQKKIMDNEVIDILFVGVEWERKGGDIAIETVRLLNEKGIASRIHVVGTNIPAKYKGLEYIIEYGFLDKNLKSQYLKLLQLYRNCHLLLVPTKAEAAGIMFSEASAWGMPCITFDTGGIGNYVLDGVNGYKLPLGASPADFANQISLIIQPNQYAILSQGARQLYIELLNWQKWKSRIQDIIQKS